MASDLSTLTALSPLDGRYWVGVNSLSKFFSEFSLIRYRVHVEVEYLVALCELQLPQLAGFPKETGFPALKKLVENFSLENAARVKEIEKVTNHDIKAVEYFIKEVL